MKPTRALSALSLALAVRVAAADPIQALPYEPPERPFLLVDAPRRFLPGEPAFVRVQNQYGGPVQIAVYRLRALQSFVTEPLDRQGVSIAAGPLGMEAEALLIRDAPLPRRGGLLDLVSVRRAVINARPRVRRAQGNESAAYDSNEVDEANTETWGVYSGDWADEPVALGLLPSGVYFVRVNAGGWSSTALVSVSPLTVLARRGDERDRVVVTDGEGAPQRDVTVQRFVDGRPGETARTGADGAVEMPAVDAVETRFVAVRGEDVAWADVTHGRASPCDVRVYLAVGRPAFRPGETVHVRGHARGCVDGRDAPLRDEPVELRTDTSSPPLATARTDADGNFIAEVSAQPELYARVRGRDHHRTLHLDGRSLPRQSLRLRFDRAWAAAGESVTVTASDDNGTWPRESRVTFRTPGGPGTAVIGPGRPAVFTFTMPQTTEALARRMVHAEVSLESGSTYAEAEVWTGAFRDVVELASDVRLGAPGGAVPMDLAVRDLGGRKHAGSVTLRVFGTDGNRPSGPARWSREVSVSDAGARPEVTLAGAGPWWIDAAPSGATRAASASIVVWERPRPASLSSRGDLAVQVETQGLAPGASLPITLRAPAMGSTLLTLEQGGVWASRWAGLGGAGRFDLPIAEGARGLATVVATHLHAGEVTSASAAVEVETSRRFGLRVSTTERTFAAGSTAHVKIAARNTDGTPRDAVVSLWVADAGWWDLAAEDHPAPDDFFRLPGRRASAGDSAHPRGYGAEEGRRLDTAIEWNGHSLSRSTFRHAWGHRTELLRFDAQGTFGDIARRMARDAGLAGAFVCPAAERRLGRVHLKVASAPWDMAAVRIADETETHAYLADRVLRFECGDVEVGVGTGSGSGYGRGAGGGGGGYGAGRSQTLDGTVFFLGLRRLGPTGETTVDVPMPAHPGRWRFESIAVADDGAGALANAVAMTTQPVEARVALPSVFAVSDESEGTLNVMAPSFAGQAVTLAATTSPGLALTSSVPSQVTLDAQGRAEVPVTVRATDEGRQTVNLRVTVASDPSKVDDVQFPVRVRSDPARVPVEVETSVGPEPTEVEVRVPALTSPSTLEVRVGGTPSDGVRAALDALHEPQFNAASLRLDRALSLLTLQSSLRQGSDPALRAEVSRALQGEIAALHEHVGASGGVAWWRRMRPSVRLTSELLYVARGHLDDDELSAALSVVRPALDDLSTPTPVLGRVVVAVLGAAPAAERARLRPSVVRALDRVMAGEHSLDALTWALRAARLNSGWYRAETVADALADALDRSVANQSSRPCAGPHWLLCSESNGDAAIMARAAVELVSFDQAHVRVAARALAWVVRHQTISPGPRWGSDSAEVVALQAALPVGVAGHDAVVRFDGREVGRVAPGRSAQISVPGDGVLTVSFDREEGRGVRVSVRGSLPAVAPSNTIGAGALSRTIETLHGAATLVTSFTVPTASRGVDLTLPLPAGYALGTRSSRDEDLRATGGRGADRWGFDLAGAWDFYALDRTPTQARPRVEEVDGALRVRYGALLPGRHTLRVPLSTAARGRFHAGPASMRSQEGAWSVTPALDVEVR